MTLGSLPLARLRTCLLAAVLTAPLLIAGCSAPTEEEATADESAVSGRVFPEGATLRVTANRLNVRSKASTSGRILVTLNRDDIVTVTERSGGNGWVKIRTAEEEEGWAAGNYLTEVDDDESSDREVDTTTADGPTCDPARARDVVSRYQKALHDTIAYAEGTRDYSKDGYNVLFGFSTVSSCAHHPNRCIRYGSTCSTAAGRYQFLNGTWRSIANTRGYATFEPENQERGAAYLIASVRRASVPSDRPLTSAEFENVITKLSYEWASLPPGRYGQPKKPMSELRGVYCSILDC